MPRTDINEPQLRRVMQYSRSRRHPVRDETIVLFSFYAGLRAKEIAELRIGDVYDEASVVRTQFILAAAHSKVPSLHVTMCQDGHARRKNYKHRANQT